MKYFAAGLMIFLTISTGQPVYAATEGGEAGSSPYFAMTPPIVVNIRDTNTIRFLQIGVQFKMTDPTRAEEIARHNDATRHALIMLFSEQDISVITRLAGKEQLRKDALDAIKSVVDKNVAPGLVEEVYFTSFIIQ